MLIVLMKRSLGAWRDIQPNTAGSGVDFISSETTLVSRRIMHATSAGYSFQSFSHSGSGMNSRGSGSSSTPPSRANLR